MGMKKNEILKVQYVNNWSPFRGKKKKRMGRSWLLLSVAAVSLS